MALSVEDVEKLCGLVPHDEFAMKGQRAGKTTRGLVHAVVAASRGKRVCLVAYDFKGTRQLTHRFLKMCEACKVTPSGFEVRTTDDAEGIDMTFGWPEDTHLMVDHYDPKLDQLLRRVKTRKRLHRWNL